ncbi:MAG: peptide/nickel transport system substrate-binding protein [Actinomycetota bacterium]|nr:peptide/nickel transport system substrate-binding protein [Actinomycetota bacterium]
MAVVAALAVIASACGSSAKKGGSNTNTGPTTTLGVVGGDDPNAKPVAGGSLTYGIEADTAGGYCLFKAQLAIGGIQVARSVYDTLTMPGADGKIHPYLAESVTGTQNNKIWTIKLRPGIKFHDGTALDAQAVKDNLDHYRKDNLLFVFVFADITAVDVVDPLTVKVTSKVPWSAFPWFLWSSSRVGIMAEAQMKSPDCNTKLIGTGPFEYVSWKFGDKFVAKRNPNYWYKDPKTGQQLPYLNQITFVPQEDGAKRTSSLEAGDFQAIHTSDAQQVVKIRKDRDAGKLKDTESDKFTEVGYAMLNATPSCSPSPCTPSPFSHLSARQAFAYAVDRDTYNRLRNDGIQQNASGPFAPGVDGYLADTGLVSFSPEKAKAAAAAYKQETGKDLTFTLNHTADPSTTQDAVLIQQMVQQNAGVKVQLHSVADQSTLIDIAISRKFDATLWRNHPGADDDTQYVWWHCANSPPAGTDPNGAPACDNPVNFGGFNDPVINTAFDKARQSSDPAVRTRLYQDINKEFAKQLWDLWSQYSLWTVGYKTDVHGILGPALPDGAKAFEGLATGHPVDGLWCDAGKC